MKFHDIIAKDAFDIGRAKFFKHKILPKTQEPIFRKQFRIADCHHDFLNEYIPELLKMGVIRESSSPYNAPIFVVKKKADDNAKLTQKFQLVNDLRALNNEVFEDKYSIREVSQCIADIGKRGSKIFTAIDLVSCFWQLPLHETSMPLTAFTVPGKGHFEFTRAPISRYLSAWIVEHSKVLFNHIIKGSNIIPKMHIASLSYCLSFCNILKNIMIIELPQKIILILQLIRENQFA